jgi:hypothetical protein
VLAIVGVSVLMFLLLSNRSSQANKATSQGDEQVVSIQQGNTSDGVAYYHCTSSSSIQLVLLHGAHFTKENYKSSGLLDRFCSKGASVTALDFSVKATAKNLKNSLMVLWQDGIVVKNRPISLVTPSASGYGVVDWINNGDLEEFRKHIRHWIPVASPAISSASIEKLGMLDVAILAIYGDKDILGRRVSEFLAQHANALVVEIPGSHPCYLDSPMLFVKDVMEFVQSHK